MAIPSLSRVESPLPLDVLCVLLCDAKMFGCPSIYATLACRSSWMVMGLSLSLSSSGKCLVLVPTMQRAVGIWMRLVFRRWDL